MELTRKINLLRNTSNHFGWYVNGPGRWFKVNLLFGSLYGSVLGGEGFVAESGGECGGAL
jgi:hypothetical protein